MLPIQGLSRAVCEGRMGLVHKSAWCVIRKAECSVLDVRDDSDAGSVTIRFLMRASWELAAVQSEGRMHIACLLQICQCLPSLSCLSNRLGLAEATGQR